MTQARQPGIDTLAIALNPEETADFLPEPLLAGIRSLARHALALDPADLPGPEFARALAAADPDVLLTCWSTPALPPELSPRLRYVCHVTGGVRQLVARAQLERGLVLTNWGGSISRVVAECALLLVLASLRQAGRLMTEMRAGGWRDRRPVGTSLFGRRVGVHGFGHGAREFIKLLRPFGADIGVCAPEGDAALYAAHGVRRVARLEDLFAGHDVIVELAPLNAATAGIVTERLLRLIPEDGVFVNVARGGIVDEDALLRVAREGRIRIGLDVYRTEPLPAASGLRALPNAILLPHTAGPTVDRRRDAGAFALRNLQAYAAGAPLEAVITPEIYDQLT